MDRNKIKPTWKKLVVRITVRFPLLLIGNKIIIYMTAHLDKTRPGLRRHRWAEEAQFLLYLPTSGVSCP